MAELLIGLNSHSDLPFLRHVLPKLCELQKLLPSDIVLMDTACDESVKSYVKKEFPQIEYLRHKDGNLGYGRAYNEILRKKVGEENGAYKYFLLMTSDVLLEPKVVAKFVGEMEKDKSIAMCAGKLHFWDSKNNKKTNQIDSLGIMAEKRHHFYDFGAGETDNGQYDNQLEHVFGISGAVFLIRIDAIAELDGGLFDERMWMYKEDVDLAYRLRWLGKKIVIFPKVWGYHARTVYNKSGNFVGGLLKADKDKKNYARAESYKNHLLMLKNNFTFKYGARVIFKTFMYEFLKGLYMAFTHPKVLFAGLKTLLFVPSRRTCRRASVKKMLNYFK
ncbi:MAG: glycosyltransferase [Candidatus Gracilibacteria bacterium]